MMEKRRRSLLREAKDEIELDKMNKQKQGKVKSIRDLWPYKAETWAFVFGGKVGANNPAK